MGQNINYVILACCTCLRPKMLFECLNSIKELQLPDNIKVELLIVDNDKNKTAFGVVEDFQNNSAVKCHYFVEEKRGLSYARNRILEEAINLGASHIMVFDDDEILTPTALLEHTKLVEQYDEDIISSGIVINKFENNAPNYAKKNISFKQKTSKKTGQLKSSCASGNVFLPTEIIKNTNIRFSEEFVFMGGEDGEFFSRIHKLGYKIVQNSESVIYELVTSARTSLKYILMRNFHHGFSGSYLKFKNNTKKMKKILYVAKLCVVVVLDLIILFPALVLGMTGFVNGMSLIMRNTGKIMGAISSKPLDFYKEIYGE